MSATFYNLRRMHALFALAATALLAVTVWMIGADHYRPWKVWQRQYRDEIEPRLTQARLAEVRAEMQQPERPAGALQREEQRLVELLARQTPGWGKRILSWPLLDAFGRPLAIDQLWLPELTLDYHFRQVPRFDRCTTCHQGIALPGRPDRPQPFAGHPRPELYVSALSPHPASEFGCTICHDGQGSATDFSWASHTPNTPAQRRAWQQQHAWQANPDWELPMLAPRFAESRCLKCHFEPAELEASARFRDPPAPKLLEGYHLVRQLGCFGCHEINGYDDRGRRVGPDLRLAAAAAAPGVPPGRMEKVGPSLRDVSSRLTADFVAAWIADPAHFRPTTRMPRFFGLHEHLNGNSLVDSQRFEAVEICAITAQLLSASRPPAPDAAPGSAQRGKQLFSIVGCLACHQHREFPAGKSVQGPDLSGLGTKYTTPAALAWLASWIRDPAQFNLHTKMPRLEVASPGTSSEAAADLAAWLVASQGEKPPSAPAVVPADLDALTALYLSSRFPPPEAVQYVQSGIPAARAAQVDADTALLVGEISTAKKLQYVGRCAIRKRGCYGCHDIPGFENAPGIGPNLSDWGRKRTALLAFEQVQQFIERHPNVGADDSPQGFFAGALRQQTREGFAWQKLCAPRSFDFQKAQAKTFNEQLLMGRFTLNDRERESIVTFLLALLAQPPAERYVAHGDRRQQALVAGRVVLDKYGCAECHTLGLPRWTIQYQPAKFGAPPDRPQFSQFKTTLPAAALAASLRTDQVGFARSELVGRPRVDAQGKLEEGEDDDGNPVYYFSLWEPAAIAGRTWEVGGAEVPLGRSQVLQRRDAWGGTFANLIFPRVLADAKAAGATATPAEVWGWLPPALVGEGRRVQPEWLYQYLLAPHAIRPAAVAPMPKFNLTADEARRLVDYFAVAAGVEYPYLEPAAQQLAATARVDAARQKKLDQALAVLRDRKTYCAKCHGVGAYGPGGESRTVWAPNLAEVSRRIRPDYLRRWLADPKSVLPYTPMPVNFPPAGDPLGQDLLPGSSVEQLDAVQDLLVNYDWYFSHVSPTPVSTGK